MAAGGLAVSSRGLTFSRAGGGGGVEFLGGCAALFASSAVPGLVLVLALFFAGGSTRSCCPAPLGFAAALRAGGSTAALEGLATGALTRFPTGVLAGFAAFTVGRAAGLISVFGRAFGLVAGLYAAAVKGAECPTGIAFGEGAIFVTTG